MSEEDKNTIELDIEAKYVDRTEKEFLSNITYAECLFILTPKNKYCDKIRELSVLKLCEIIEKLQKENEKLQEENEELNTRLQEAINEKCELKTELYLNSMPKSKIKDKIETYRRVISDSNDGDLIHDLRTKINILEELLENNKK